MRVIDLFCGCGGMSLGFENAGFSIVAAFDNWSPAVKVYQENFKHPIYQVDLSDTSNVPNLESFFPDMIIGGPPCQDFSSAGKRDEGLGRADLTVSFAKIVSKQRPEWFVMENVERITKSQALKDAIKTYKKAGYGISAKVLNASYCGVPQARKRFFMVGHLHASDGFLDTYFEENQSQKAMTIRDYLGNTLGLEHYYRHPRSYKRRGVFSIDEPSPTVRGVNRPVPKGYSQHAGDPCDINNNIRPLTTIERSYIQTFPKNFKFFGNKTDLEQIIGNAVPVNLAEYVGKCINQYICDSRNKIAKKDKAFSQLSLECL